MIVIYTEEQWKVMEEFVKRQNKIGLKVHLLNRDEARQRQPAFAKTLLVLHAVLWMAEVNPLHLTIGFFQGAKNMEQRLY